MAREGKNKGVKQNILEKARIKEWNIHLALGNPFSSAVSVSACTGVHGLLAYPVFGVHI